MIVTFFGHAQFQGTQTHKQALLSILEEQIGDAPCEMYLGGYGGFDRFAYECCKEYQKKHKNVSLILVLAYLREKKQSAAEGYDRTLYPTIEDKPLRFAISYRNRYMAEKADLVIAFVQHNFGGAYQGCKHARRKGKKVFNLASGEHAP